jgi:hypothetical protein
MSIFQDQKYRISAARTYYAIASDQAARFHECAQARASAEERPCAEGELAEAFEQIETNYERQGQAAMIVITFAAMALEAFFYDYAADALGDNYVKDHIDKLDLPSKYLVYPKLVCGKGPDKSDHTFELVDKLNKLRNLLVHSKSRAFPLEDLGKASDHHDAYNARLTTGVRESIECVRAVMRELDKLHPGHSFEAAMQ